jgi:hypothetical protein
MRTVGDCFDNALAETVNGYYKSELIYGPARSVPWKTIEDVELATLGWVHWHNTSRQEPLRLACFVDFSMKQPIGHRGAVTSARRHGDFDFQFAHPIQFVRCYPLSCPLSGGA